MFIVIIMLQIKVREFSTIRVDTRGPKVLKPNQATSSLTPYKERYIAGSSTCSTKELSIHLTKIRSAVKERQQKYCETVYSRSGINHMWILKNSKDLLDNLKSRSFSQVSSIKTFDFSTLYTTLPHDKLKTRLKETFHKAFSHRNYGSKFVVLGYNSTYFSNKIQKGKTCYSEE